MRHHLTSIDYTTMPWANGLGETIEIIRRDDEEGKLLWRLSMATVTEDGPFSIFPDVERNLTVLTGDGFDLIEDESRLQHTAVLLIPIAFSGKIPVTAKNVTAPCQDFNVMTRSDLPKPTVWVEQNISIAKTIKGMQLALFAISDSTVNTAEGALTLKANELLFCQKSAQIKKGNLICVSFDSSIKGIFNMNLN